MKASPYWRVGIAVNGWEEKSDGRRRWLERPTPGREDVGGVTRCYLDMDDNVRAYDEQGRSLLATESAVTPMSRSQVRSVVDWCESH